MQRKVIQIAVQSEGDSTMPGLFALCDDGSMYVFSVESKQWGEIPPIPQKPVERSFIGQKKEESKAYHNGFNDGLTFAPMKNPHMPGTEEYRDYDKGWCEARVTR